VRLVPTPIVGLKRTLAHFGQLQIEIVVLRGSPPRRP
jgi:hypothetical protein